MKRTSFGGISSTLSLTYSYTRYRKSYFLDEKKSIGWFFFSSKEVKFKRLAVVDFMIKLGAGEILCLKG